MGQLDGRIAVITGGGRGIGRAIALRYAQEGATVVVSSRTQADLDEVVDAMGSGLGIVADALDKHSARRPVDAAVDTYGRIDILVNNVGGSMGHGHDPFDGDDESFEQTVMLNLVSHFWTTRAALKPMRDQHYGRIVNIPSSCNAWTIR